MIRIAISAAAFDAIAATPPLDHADIRSHRRRARRGE
jgi:hypothetical protein